MSYSRQFNGFSSACRKWQLVAILGSRNGNDLRIDACMKVRHGNLLVRAGRASSLGDGSRADPAAVGVHADVAAAHDGDDAPAGEAVAVFEDRRDAERGRGFDDKAGVIEEHS